MSDIEAAVRRVVDRIGELRLVNPLLPYEARLIRAILEEMTR